MYPRASYIVCATPRSGSTVLCEALKKIEIAGRPEEYFGLRDMPLWHQRWETKTYVEYIAGALKQGTTPNGIFGAKIMWYQMHEFTSNARQIPEYKHMKTHEIVNKIFPDLHYIWIWRRDKVRQAISHAKARQTNLWKITAGEPTLPSTRATFSFEQIDYMVHEMAFHDREWKKYFKENNINPLEIIYEDLVTFYAETTAQTLRYLELPIPEHLDVTPRLQRQSDEETEEWVRLYYELKSRRKRYWLLSLTNSIMMPALQTTKIGAFISKKRAYINH